MTSPPAPRAGAEQRPRLPAGVAIASGLGFAAGLAWLHNAPVLLTPQGLSYLVAARSLIEGHGLETAPGVPFANFGPLYAVLLAAGAVAGLGVIPTVYLVNCAALAAALVALHRLGRALGIRPLAALLAFFAVWSPNFYLLRAARPDLLVVCLSLFAVAAALRFREAPSTAALLAAALACALAALGRYLAIFTLLPVVFAALWSFHPTGGRRRLRDLALFFLVAGGPPALWMLRNQLLTGFLTGISRTAQRAQAAETTLLGNLGGLLRTAYLDVFGHQAMGVRPLVYDGVAAPHPYLTALTALACTGLVVYGLLARRAVLRRFAQPDPLRGGARSALILVAASVGCYLAVLVLLWTVGNNDPINTRYVAPIYPFLILAAFASYTHACPIDAAARRIRLAFALTALLIAIPQIAKSLELLGDAPSEALLEVRSRSGKLDRWFEEVPWSR